MSKNEHLRIFLFLLLATNICFARMVQGDVHGAYILTVSDFESHKNTNILGGKTGVWEKASENNSEWCVSKHIKTVLGKKKTTVLCLNYKVGPQDYNGYYSKLNGIDVRPYNSLEFYVKGGKNFPKEFKLELKNQYNENGYYYVKNIRRNKWRKISIPLEDFNGLTDFSRMKELVVVFEGTVLGDSAGEIFIDNIIFKGSPDKYLKAAEEKALESKKSKKKFEELSQLPEDEFLELISRKLFNYFWNETSPRTGFIKDRSISGIPSSVAATGFGLAAICIADYRQWILHEQAYNRVKTTLTAIKNKSAHQHGVYYHFIDMDTGQRMWKSEVSSIDTALLLAGIVVVREYFSENDIKKLCDEIYEKINWKWMMDVRTKALYMGWVPESGFDKFILWNMFAEEMVMYILGMGATNNSLPGKSWHSFRRPVKKYKDYTYIYCDTESLFTYLFSHAFIDFQEKHDKYADYWRNSISAIKSSIEFTSDHKDSFKTYREGFWGISAGDGPEGYKNYGAVKLLNAHDGTIMPYAICGSIPFVPEKAISTLRKLLLMYGKKVWCDNYGFVSSFNLDKSWFSTEHIGIDLGISLLMIENYRSGFVWKYFMKNENVKRGMKKAGFKEGIKETITDFTGEILKAEDRLIQKEYHARKTNSPYKFKKEDFMKFDFSSDIEYGVIESPHDLAAKFAFIWDEEFLYFTIEVTDDTVLAKRRKEELFKDDCIELYLSPNSNMLIWGNNEHFQIGFAPCSLDGKPVKYSFFQNEDPEEIVFSVKNISNGYKIEAKIQWEYLKIKPEKGKFIGMSVAVHDVDRREVSGKKINWSFINTPEGIKLGKLILK